MKRPRWCHRYPRLGTGQDRTGQDRNLPMYPLTRVVTSSSAAAVAVVAARIERLGRIGAR